MFILTTINITESRVTVRTYTEESEASEMVSLTIEIAESLKNTEFVIVLYNVARERIEE